MALESVPIRRVGNRYNLFLNADRELTLFAGIMAAALIFTGLEWLSTFYGVVLWVCVLYMLRLMAKSDPLMRHVYFRSRKYEKYYPARSTPFRINTDRQAGQYK